jgi:hypothetical protein
MDLRRLPVLIASPITRPQQRARDNARRAAAACLERRHEREDVEVFLTKVLPEQRRRRP